MLSVEFSLILATVGRVQELAEFLKSLTRQTNRDFELIVVDQNPDDRLAGVLGAHRGAFPILHLRAEPGLSRARNIGLAHARGQVLAFPDDDCLYPPDLLHKVAERLRAHPEWKGLTGRVVSPKGAPSVGRFDRREGFLTRQNVWTRGISVTLFLRTEVVRAVGPFDENLGVGSWWGSGEETDYLLRILAMGYPVFYCPEIVVMHPPRSLAPERARSYGRGMGRVLRKHRYPLWAVSYHLARPLGGALLHGIRANLDRARIHWEVFLGRWEGWWRGR